MMVRHDQIDFASGALVFPGGSVDASDKDVVARPELFNGGGISDPVLLGLRVAALRETFEESGILLARPQGSSGLISRPNELRRSRLCIARHCAKGKIKFPDILAEAKLVLALDLLVPYALWITPARFAQAASTPTSSSRWRRPTRSARTMATGVLVDSVWVSPHAALDGATTGRFKLLFPTTRNLIKLGKQASAAAAITSARADKVVTHRAAGDPEREDGRREAEEFPPIAGYDGEIFDMTGP